MREEMKPKFSKQHANIAKKAFPGH